MSWKPEVHAEGEWVGNGLVFATKAESDKWGQDLLNRWFVPDAARSVESNEPVNYKIENGVLIAVK